MACLPAPLVVQVQAVAQKLRNGILRLTTWVTSSDAPFETPTTMLLDVGAVRFNPDQAAAQSFKFDCCRERSG